MRQELQLQPQQILRSELIQLPLLELEMRVSAEMEENPFLEEYSETEEDPEAKPESDNSDSDSTNDTEVPIETDPRTENREVDWEDFLNDADHWEYKSKNKSSSAEDYFDIPQPDVLTLSDHLHDQLRLGDFDKMETTIGEEIIGNLNKDGYLTVELQEIMVTLDTDYGLVEDVHNRILYEFDPVGIAARNLRECLLVQLKRQDSPPPIATRMIEHCWDNFINKRFEVIANRLDITLNDVKEAFGTISKLNPKPGEGYFNEKQNYIIPDLVVANVGNEFVVYLNDGDIPNFRINPTYRELYLNKKGTEKTVKEFLSRKFESARWFINAIHQRRTTMVRTMRAIVQRQHDFFEHGPNHIKPMILANIATDIGMDISTISRVTRGKYVQTEWGVFELKYFFTDKMTSGRGDVSNRIIKQKLSDIIASENKKKPYSDQELTDLLNKEGYNIKRRTVAKYREQMRIPVKRLRREI